MVSFYEGDSNNLLVSIAGDNFSSLLNVCRTYGGKFNTSAMSSSGGVLMRVWSFDQVVTKPLIDSLLAIEPTIVVPEWLLDKTPEDDPDFKRFRAAIDPSLVMSDYKGDYQRKAILKGISQNRLALFHEMGLGKSFEIITILNHLIHSGQVEKFIILSPPEGVVNIARECIKFSSFGLTWNDIYIVSPNNRRPFEDPTKKVVIMTYRNLIMLHDDYYYAKMKKRSSKRIVKNYIPWEQFGSKLAIVLDESAAIKSRSSKTWKIANKAKKYFNFRYLMTGTPAPKGAEDLWTQVRFLQEKCVPTEFETFIKMIASAGNRYSDTAVNYYYPEKVQEFLDSVSYLVDRVKAEGNVDLPPLDIQPVYCLMTSKQKLLYKNLVERTIITIQEQDGVIKRNKLKNKFSYFTLALHDPSIIRDSDSFDETASSPEIVQLLHKWSIEDNGKYEVCLSLLEKYAAKGKKTILWSGHPAIIDALAKKFSKFNPMTLHAKTVVNKGESVSERNAALVDQFVNSNSKVLIANYACLKTSANITEASRQIFWDRSWDAEIFAQAVKRSHRIGQQEQVIINTLLFAESIEEEQDAVISKRLNFNGKVWVEQITDTDEKEDEVVTLSECKRIFTGNKIM